MRPLGASHIFPFRGPRWGAPCSRGPFKGLVAAFLLLPPLLLLPLLSSLPFAAAFILSPGWSGGAFHAGGPPSAAVKRCCLAGPLGRPPWRAPLLHGTERQLRDTPGGPPCSQRLYANAAEGLSVMPAPNGAPPVLSDAPRLIPLFPELQTAPESTASAELTTTKFSDIAEIHPEIVKTLERRGIVCMTAIQLKTFGPVYSGRDVIGRSETGSGKTLAFVLPLLEKIAKRRARAVHTLQRVQPQLLVLAPTRELARQVHSEVEAVGAPLGLTAVCLFGGVALQQQIRVARETSQGRRRQQQQQPGIDVIVATPGRLIDFLGLADSRGPGGRGPVQELIDLTDVRHVVLDEADEMLKLGFAEAVELILANALSPSRPFARRPAEGGPLLPAAAPAAAAGRQKGTGPQAAAAEADGQADETDADEADSRQQQVLLFSATQPSWVRNVAGKYLRDPILIDAVSTRTHRPHVAIEIPSSLSPSSLASVIQDCVLSLSGRDRQSIVFVATKAEADQLAHAGALKGGLLSSAVLHGGIQQESREKIMEGFRQGRYKALICTDVAARGIDVANVDLVVHCGVAFDSDVFIHRSGRTGRAGRRGTSLLLHTAEERREVDRLTRRCGIQFESRDLPSVDEVLAAASASVSRQLDELPPTLTSFFMEAATDLLRRAKAHNITEQDLLARALAVGTGLKELPSRSLLSLRPGLKTLELRREGEGWKSEEEAEACEQTRKKPCSSSNQRLMHASNDHVCMRCRLDAQMPQTLEGAPKPWRVGPLRQHAEDPTRVYFDVSEGAAEAVISTLLERRERLQQAGKDVSVCLPSKRPPLTPLRGEGKPFWWGPRDGSGQGGPPCWRDGARVAPGRRRPPNGELLTAPECAAVH
ncbi:hypothetical protein Efla_003623 [Eimeria flavescens]